MNKCFEMQSFADSPMDEARRAELLEHVATCPVCQRDKAFWERFEPPFQDWVQSTDEPGPTHDEAKLFMHRAGSTRQRSSGTNRLVIWGTALSGAAAAILIVLYIAPSEPSFESVPTTQVAERPAVQPEPTHVKILESTPTSTSLEKLDSDTVGLDLSSRVAVLESKRNKTRLRLEHGSAAFDVTHKAAGEAFEVQVASGLVRVVGTRFLVSHKGPEHFEVAVSEGVVEVIVKETHTRRVKQGNRLLHAPDGSITVVGLEPAQRTKIVQLLGPDETKEEVPTKTEPDAKSAPAPKALPALETLATYRQMVLSGELQDARDGLKHYVRAHPSDADGWMLLADCVRKLKDWPGAVRAYKSAMNSSDRRVAAKATYLAADVLGRRMKKHQEASQLYEKYLGSSEISPALRDTVKVSYVRSLIAVGQKSKAKAVLNEVLNSSTDSIASKNAKHLLETLESQD